MGTIKKEMLIGALVSIFATCAGFYIYVQYISRFGFYETIDLIREGDLLGSILVLASLPNLFVFFVFIKKKQDYRARGVLIVSMCIALFTFVQKFIL